MMRTTNSFQLQNYTKKWTTRPPLFPQWFATDYYYLLSLDRNLKIDVFLYPWTWTTWKKQLNQYPNKNAHDAIWKAYEWEWTRKAYKLRKLKNGDHKRARSVQGTRIWRELWKRIGPLKPRYPLFYIFELVTTKRCGLERCEKKVEASFELKTKKNYSIDETTSL